MVELNALSPAEGLLPIEAGGVTLSEVDLGVLTSLSPYRGQGQALSDALQSAHGMAFPAANRATGKAGARCIWFGRDQALLAGPVPSGDLAQYAAVTDQSDAWVAVSLEGAGAEDVLARLCPLDLRRGKFKRGHTARSQIQHINGSITRTGDTAFLILAFRSMAGTLVHELGDAMKNLAARQAG